MVFIDKLIKRQAGKIGLPPGTAVYTGEKPKEKVTVSLIDYDPDRFCEEEVKEVESVVDYLKTSSVSWLNIDGLHEADLIERIGKIFDLHPLVIEDIVNPWQRPKMEDFDRTVYIVLNMLRYDESKHEILGEQVSLVLGKNFVFSFQERPGDIFELIRNRIRSGKGRIRKMGADYLAYSLLDAVVDQYFVILEKVGERVEELEDLVVAEPKPETLREIHRLKREMLFLRKSVWPLRELINGLEKSESELITKSTQRFLRDVYDHSIQVIDTVETMRDMLSGMHDTYLSSISNRMNEVMKVLTIIATIFIPLTFIAGIYGMNFEFMPELKLPWGYAGVWGIIIVVALLMIWFFRRKKWL